jgi:protein-S-isoprenylcysteine O-methyltransferase Ste14
MARVEEATMTRIEFVRAAFLAWGLSEVVFGFLARGPAAASAGRDRGSQALVWAAVVVGAAAMVALHRVPGTRIPLPAGWILGIGAVLLVAGVALRLTAILTLRRFFTTRVTIRADHELVRRGVYRIVRHPSYSGLLLAFCGMGLAYGTWLSFLGFMAPITAAVLYRIAVEERALRATFGEAYAEYGRRTRRLVPGLY